jgi:hypothetical protein
MAYQNEPVRDSAPRGDGQGGIYAILVIIVILIVAAILYFAGVFGGRGADGTRDIDIRIETPDIGGDPPATPPSPAPPHQGGGAGAGGN